MATKKTTSQQPAEEKTWSSVDQVNKAIERLQRRLTELEAFDIRKAYFEKSGEDSALLGNVKATIRDQFGQNSPEYREHANMTFWSGAIYIDMSDAETANALALGVKSVAAKIKGLIARLQEKREDFGESDSLTTSGILKHLNLHPRIAEVASELFSDGYYTEAVFAAAKALVNYVKDRSGQDIDGANLMRTVFSKNKPILAFSDLEDQTKQDEQEGMMYLFVGVVLGIRNPGGHAFPEGSEQRAAEYLSLISLLCYRTQEAKRIRTT